MSGVVRASVKLDFSHIADAFTALSVGLRALSETLETAAKQSAAMAEVLRESEANPEPEAEGAEEVEP